MKWFDTVLLNQAANKPELNRLRQMQPLRGGLQIIRNSIIENPDDAWGAIKDFQGVGWVTTVDEIIENWNGQHSASYPLWAEMTRDDTSISLRHAGEQWQLNEIKRVDDDQQRLFIEYFARRPVGDFGYEIAWRQQSGRWQPWLARLASIDELAAGDS